LFLIFIDRLLSCLKLKFLSLLSNILSDGISLFYFLLLWVELGQLFGDLLKSRANMLSALGAELNMFDIFSLAIAFNF